MEALRENLGSSESSPSRLNCVYFNSSSAKVCLISLSILIKQERKSRFGCMEISHGG